MVLTSDQKKYLEHKHQGGLNNQKGASYEDYYAVFQIVVYARKYKKSLDCVFFQTQLKDSFVDDLLIVYPSQKKVYHQLKNTKRLSWGEVGVKGDLAYDFCCQIQICSTIKESFVLKLVHSLGTQAAVSKIPKSISKQSRVEYFEYADSLEKLILTYGKFNKSLRRIAAQGEKATDDELLHIATVFLGLWKRKNTTQQVDLKKLVDGAIKCKVNLSIYDNVSISPAFEDYLDSIEGLEYYLCGLFFYWQIGKMSGACEWTDECETAILKAKPTNKWELIELLSNSAEE